MDISENTKYALTAFLGLGGALAVSFVEQHPYVGVALSAVCILGFISTGYDILKLNGYMGNALIPIKDAVRKSYESLRPDGIRKWIDGLNADVSGYFLQSFIENEISLYGKSRISSKRELIPAADAKRYGRTLKGSDLHTADGECWYSDVAVKSSELRKFIDALKAKDQSLL